MTRNVAPIMQRRSTSRVGWQSKTEKSIVEGTRSDLIFSQDDGRQIIIEVVNTHSIEPETRKRVSKIGNPSSCGPRQMGGR